MASTTGSSCGIFVQGPGTGRSIIAGAAGGVLASAAAERVGRGAGGDGPLGPRQLGYLAVEDDRVVLYGAKRKALMGGFKATEDVLASLARPEVATAALEQGTLLGTLLVTFADGSGWTFEVPKVGNKAAGEAVAALAGG
jgi:hypothetical protein